MSKQDKASNGLPLDLIAGYTNAVRGIGNASAYLGDVTAATETIDSSLKRLSDSLSDCVGVSDAKEQISALRLQIEGLERRIYFAWEELPDSDESTKSAYAQHIEPMRKELQTWIGGRG